MISVCMATFNGELFIREQIFSILSQLTKNDELIISDDGSTDNTVLIVESFEDVRIRFYYNSGEKGYTRNFENALRQAAGDVIFLSDQDDIWTPNKVERTLAVLEHCSFVVSDACIINENMEVISDSYFSLHNVKKGFLNNFIRCRYLGCCLAFKREVLKKALPFPNNSLIITHDYWLSLVGCAFYKSTLINDKLIKYRRHGSNTSDGGVKSQFSFLQIVNNRFYVMCKLLRCYFKKR